MKWILRAIPILLLMVCFGGQAMPEDLCLPEWTATRAIKSQE